MRAAPESGLMKPQFLVGIHFTTTPDKPLSPTACFGRFLRQFLLVKTFSPWTCSYPFCAPYSIGTLHQPNPADQQ